MSEYLNKTSKQWESLKVLFNDLYTGPCGPGSDQQCKFFKMDNRIAGVSKEVAIIIEALHNEQAIITIDDWTQFFTDILAIRLGKIGDSWFHPSLEVHTGFEQSEFQKMLHDSGEDFYFKLFLNQIKYWEISDDQVDRKKVVKRKETPVRFGEDIEKKLRENILEMADNGNLAKLSTKLIGEVLKEYKLSDFEEAMAKKINDRFQDVDNKYGGGGLSFLYDHYIGLKSNEGLLSGGTTGYYTLSENIYVDEPTKIPFGILSSAAKEGFEFPAAVVYPDAIVTDFLGNINEDALNELRNFDELTGTKISEYPFKYQIDAFPSKAWYSTSFFPVDITNTVSTFAWVKALRSFVNDTQTPNDVIKDEIISRYLDFLRKVGDDFKENKELTETIGEHWTNALTNDELGLGRIFSLIYFEKVIAAKKELFDRLSKSIEEEGEEGEAALTPEELENAYKAQATTFQEGRPPDLPDEPSEEDIANRQKYFKQCALMLNMPELRDSYQQKLKQRYARKLPFGGRFTTLYAKDKEQETTLTSLVSSQNEQLLFELESWKVSKLVPKVRLFKVFHDHEKGEKEVEFIFDRSSNIRDTFMNPNVFDKGTGVGLKNFSFEFNGTTPATARNDITANLTLFFQSFQDFLRTRQGYSDEYRYVDLVIQPTPDKKGQYAGIDIQSDRQYEPQFYRIRADVGYVLPTEADGFSRDEIEAIRVSNKSFFLNMVDHDISFGKDGTVEIKISYRAYLESLLKHPRLDALASPELIARRIENAKTFSEQVQKRECSVDQLKELQVTLAAQEEIILKQSLSSIITRLKNRGVIYKALIDKKDKEHFLKKGFFRKCELERTSQDDGSNGADVKLVLNSDLPESSEDFGFIDSANRSVQFFYFGDLLYTILDCVYDANDNVRAGTGYDRNSIILGSFEFEPFQQISAGSKVYNIADLPISVDFFSRWFVDNVMSQKSTRKTFPVMNFIRSLSNYLIKPSIIENCVNRKMETRLRFQTTQITAFEPGGVNPLNDRYSLQRRNDETIALDVEDLRTRGVLPLRGGPENDANSNFKDFHTFVVLSAIGSTLTYAGNGNYGEDIERGRFHVHVGQNAGLVKTLSLSKSDMQYIREARFFQNGIDGLLQLSAVYVANLEMFGNTLFYPGMEFFFNPFGIGGENFDPTEAGSDANKLGIGGYHTITSVKSSITPGKFTTSISAQQYYSGDGSGNPNIVKKKNADRKANSIESYTPEDPNNEQGFANCKNVILAAQNYDFEEGSASSSAASASDAEYAFVGPPMLDGGSSSPNSSSSTAAPVEAPTQEAESEASTPETTAVATEVIESPEVESTNTDDNSSNEEASDSNVNEETVVVTQETLETPQTFYFKGEFVTSGTIYEARGPGTNRQSMKVSTTSGVFYRRGDKTIFFSNDGVYKGEEVTSDRRIYSREEEKLVE